MEVEAASCFGGEIVRLNEDLGSLWHWMLGAMVLQDDVNLEKGVWGNKSCRA